MNKVSVHILYNPTNNIYQDNIKILKEIIEATPYGVAEIVEGVAGHIGKSRLLGWSSSKETYSSFADDDDIILDSDYFRRAVEFLDTHPEIDGYTGRERIEDIDSITESPRPSGIIIGPGDLSCLHHLVVLRTSVVRNYLKYMPKYKIAPEYALHAQLIYDGIRIMSEDDINYVWRKNIGISHPSKSPEDVPELYDISDRFHAKFGFHLL